MPTDASAEQLLPPENPENPQKSIKQSAEKRLWYTVAQVEKLESQTKGIPETEKKNAAAAATIEAGTKKLEQQTNQEWIDLRDRIASRISAVNNNILYLQREIQNLGRLGRFIGRITGTLRGMQLSLEADQNSLRTLNNLRQRLAKTVNSPTGEVLQSFWRALGIVRPNYGPANTRLAESRTIQFVRPTVENTEKINQEDWKVIRAVEREVQPALRQSASKYIESVLGPNGETVIKMLQSHECRDIALRRRDPNNRGMPWVFEDSRDVADGAVGNYSINAIASNNRHYSFEFRSNPPAIQIRMSINGNPYGTYSSLAQVERIVQRQNESSISLERILGPNGQRVVALLQSQGFREIAIRSTDPGAARIVEGIDTEMSPYSITASGSNNRHYAFNFQPLNERAPSPFIVIQVLLNNNPLGFYTTFEQLEKSLASDIRTAIAAERKAQEEKREVEESRMPRWRRWLRRIW